MNTEQPFAVTIEKGDDDVARVIVVGEVDLQTAPVLRQSLTEAAALVTGPVAVDLEGVGFLDSTGLNALLGARSALQREGRALTVAKASSRVQRVFEVTGVVELFSGEGDAADAADDGSSEDDSQ